MKHAHQAQFGRLATAVQTKPDHGVVDKWDVLTALTHAAEDYDLNHRTLTVLKALLSFHRGRLITPSVGSAIVFPSNRSLSERLGNMPESTLRRHLAALVAAGIVTRHDSANRKRFARKRAGGLLAFGFDLSPLAREYVAITRLAKLRQEQVAEVQTLRTEAVQLKARLSEIDTDHPLLIDLHKLLRRKLSADQLQDIIDNLSAVITEKMSASDSQNERHIYTEDINISERLDQPETTSLDEIVAQCEEYKSYFPEPARDWHELAKIADRLTPMMGIDAEVFKSAIRDMGLKRAVVSVLCILENMPRIANPGGYLRRLTQNAMAGQFHVQQLMKPHQKTQKLSADNPNNRLLSVA